MTLHDRIGQRIASLSRSAFRLATTGLGMVLLVATLLQASSQESKSQGSQTGVHGLQNTDLNFFLLPIPQETTVAKVKSAADIAALDLQTREVELRLEKAELLGALADRLPRLRKLVLHHPGNHMDLEHFKHLARFTKIESLTITGDLFLYDAEFEVLGSLKSLRSLKLSLP